MTEVPKIVHDRLRAAGLEREASRAAHPDADLLTALAEQALPAQERESVLAHLAQCGECREIVALALPAESPAAAMPETTANAASDGAMRRRSSVFAWPRLRWAALAAGVAVAASILVMHPGIVIKPLSSGQSEITAAARPTNIPKAPSQAAQSSSGQADSERVILGVVGTIESRKPETGTQAKEESRGRRENRPAANVAQAGSGIVHDLVNLPEGTFANERAASKKAFGGAVHAASAPGTGSATPPATPAAAPSASHANETVEVSSEMAVVPETAQLDDSLTSRRDAPAIAKAKEPASEKAAVGARSVPVQTEALAVQVETQSAPVANTVKSNELSKLSSRGATLGKQALADKSQAWSIQDGILRRSLDGGVRWEDALHAPRPMLCYATYGQDVWAGGEGGALYHSADGGVSWAQVQPAIKGAVLSADITHIDLDHSGAGEIAVSTRDNQIWSSTDVGRNWIRKQ